jgi:phosphopantothenoylcysteine decarboxylase/phosphopantothenate--cysteine ligase
VKGKRIVIGVGGGIAAYKAAILASRLVQLGASVRVAMTQWATQFVGPLTFEGLTGTKVILAPTQVDTDGSVPHIDAARGADAYVIAPCTADLLSKLVTGAADDPVSLLALTMKCPVVVCPAMNDAMWTNAAVQHNASVVASRGVHVVGPVVGHLAEGYDAIGRMVEPEAIVAALEKLLGSCK